jgi:hypothetical protein
MLPDNELSQKVIRSSLLYPDRFLYASLTEDYEYGGLAIQDPSEGLLYQPWFGYWRKDDNAICIRPLASSEDVVLFYEEDVFEFSFTFDQNMRWCSAVQKTDGSLTLRWFDSAVGDYVVTPYEGIEGFKLCLDDKREDAVRTGVSDMLFTYIKNNKLYVRNQRERFLVEHLLQEDLPNNLRITNFGMSERLRVMWRLRYRRPWELMPWLV